MINHSAGYGTIIQYPAGGYSGPKNMNGKNTGPELPSIEKFASRREWEAVCWESLLKCPELIRLLATSRDRRAFAAKAYAVQGLKSGKSYREIGKESWLSPQTISALQKAIIRHEYQSYSEYGRTREKPGSPLRSSRSPRRRVRTKYGTLRIPY